MNYESKAMKICTSYGEKYLMSAILKYEEVKQENIIVFRVLLEKKCHTVCTFKTILIVFHCRYILLKERNKIMTLESELERQGLYMTDAWRMDKVSQNNQILHFS